MPYRCEFCGRPISNDIDRTTVTLFLAPPDGSWEKEKSTPFILSIQPCCGRRECVEAAWEKARNSSIGAVEMPKEPKGPDAETQDKAAKHSRFWRVWSSRKDKTNE